MKGFPFSLKLLIILNFVFVVFVMAGLALPPRFRGSEYFLLHVATAIPGLLMGIGLLKRMNAVRILMLVIGGFGLLVGILLALVMGYVFKSDPGKGLILLPKLLLYIGFNVWQIWVLVQPKVVALFKDHSSFKAA